MPLPLWRRAAALLTFVPTFRRGQDNARLHSHRWRRRHQATASRKRAAIFPGIHHRHAPGSYERKTLIGLDRTFFQIHKLRGRQQRFGEIDVLESAIRELSSRAFDIPDPDDIEEKAMTEAALRVVIERLASDKLASGRLSQQRERFEGVMKICIRSREQRARENGRSYITSLI
jgi:hypothetical protein